METAEPVRRTSEIEEITNLYFVHPIASRLVPVFAALRISPNAVSLAGMGFGVLAGFAYASYQDVRYAIAGFGLMIAWHVMDGADGQLARLTHSHSQFGKVLDGICDYVTFAAVYAGLATALSGEFGNWVWMLIVAAGLCHAVQAAAYEMQRQEYNFWGWNRKSAAPLELGARRARAGNEPLAQRFSQALDGFYTRVQFLVAGVSVSFRKRLAAALELHPEREALIRQRYREVFAPSVRRWSVMSSNYRTIGIFGCALLKAPLYYFWFEIIGLSAVLIVFLLRQSARRMLFLREVEAAV